MNITVISGPLVDVLLSTPVSGPEGFQFNYTANPGLRYIVEGSLNQDGPEPFTPIATNTANTNLVTFTDSTSTGRTNRSYRVRRAP